MGATGVGTLLIPNTVALVKGGPHPKQAAALMDFLLSEKVERMLAESVSRNAPVRTTIAAEFAGNSVPDPLRVDYVQAAQVRSQAISQAMKWLDGPREQNSTSIATRPVGVLTPLRDGEPFDTSDEPGDAR
jgi:ABC-type Fe3+ transport system substrate-binding protein